MQKLRTASFFGKLLTKKLSTLAKIMYYKIMDRIAVLYAVEAITLSKKREENTGHREDENT